MIFKVKENLSRTFKARKGVIYRIRINNTITTLERSIALICYRKAPLRAFKMQRLCSPALGKTSIMCL